MKFNVQKIPFTTIPKNFLKDKCLSLKAKGLLTVMFSLPEEWNYNFKGLMKITNAGETQIKNILNELKIAGYIEIIKGKNELGQFEYIYHIYYEPIPTEFNGIDIK